MHEKLSPLLDSVLEDEESDGDDAEKVNDELQHIV